jgi:hypothetical protein
LTAPKQAADRADEIARGHFEAPASPIDRCDAFVRAYMAADANADIEMRYGMMAGVTSAIIIAIDGAYHGFTVREAEKLAEIFEDAMRLFPGTPETAGFDNMILLLRHMVAKHVAASPAPPEAISGKEG